MNPIEYEASLEEKFRKRFSERFYSCIEIEPGLFTKGTTSPNIALTRELLKRTQIEGKDCVDVAAVDGWCCILLRRRGAHSVVAFDRNDFSPLISEVQQKLAIDFDYFPLVKSQEWAEVAKLGRYKGFDVVVNSGLLYHVLGPVNTLAHSRSLVRTGGIMIVETVFDKDAKGYEMSFNAFGSKNKNDPTFFWSLSPKVFDYVLRMLRLLPIDMVFYGQRMAIACRAVPDVIAPPGDSWVQETYKARDILDLTDWSILEVKSTVDYAINESPLGIDVSQCYQNSSPLSFTEDQIKIGLGCTY